MNRGKNLFCYLMVAPALIAVILLGIYPMLQTLWLSVVNYDLLTVATEGTPFVGADNYIEIFSDDRFVQSLVNTLTFTVIVVTSVVLLGLLIAHVLNMDFPGRSVVRVLVLVPWFIPPVVASMVWLWMFQPDQSPINNVLKDLGLIQRNIKFLTDTNTIGPVSIPMLSVSAVRAWHGLPFVIIFILAGLQSLPAELYEAAQIDGATVMQRFFYLTLPLLRPVLSILVVLLVIGGIGHFEVNYVMTAGGPRNLTNILAVHAYQQAFSFYRFDLASAASSIILLITGPIAVFYIYYQIKRD